jgi:hypothetical protein
MEKVDFKPFKKTGIVMFGGRLITKRHNGYMAGEVLPYLRKYILEELKRDVCDYITTVNVTDPERSLGYYVDIEKIDINDYEEIFIFNSLLTNLWGGVVNDLTLKTIKALNKFKGDIWYYLDDPDFGYVDMGKFLNDKLTIGKLKFGKDRIKSSELEQYTKDVNPRVNVVWVGLDYEKYHELNDHNKKQPHQQWTNILMAPYIFAKKNEIFKDYPFEREFDVMYYGKKKPDRIKVLNSYFKNDTELSKYWLGYDPGPAYNLKELNEKGIGRNLLIDELCRGYSTLILGSKSHNGNLISPRYLECMSSDLVCFIHHEYYDEKIVKNKELKNLLVVKDIKEYKDKLKEVKSSEKFFRDVIKQQREEIQNFKNGYVPDERGAAFKAVQRLPGRLF